MPPKTLSYPRRDLSNIKQGRLEVIKFLYYKQDTKDRRFDIWECKCFCGKIFEVRGNSITNGQKSCGCLLDDFRKNELPLLTRKRNIKSEGESSKNHLYDSYKRRAKVKNIQFELKMEDFINITKKNCFYCGIEPKQKITKPKYNGSYVYNGIDRKNNKFGYTYDNVLTCCGICNKAKRDLTEEEFKRWIKRLIDHQLKSSQ